MVRERCSCGAEFETDAKAQLRLLREWRTTHKCQPPLQDGGTHVAQIETTQGDPRWPELHIGFRTDPDSE